MAKLRHKSLVAVYLLPVKNGKILLIQRTNTGYGDGNFSLPAGHLEKNETLTQALIREVREEIGITLKFNNLILNQVIHYKSTLGGLEYLDFFFMAKTWGGMPKNLEPNKCGGLKWFALTNLPKNMVLEVKQALINLDKKIIYSELNWQNYGTLGK